MTTDLPQPFDLLSKHMARFTLPALICIIAFFAAVLSIHVSGQIDPGRPTSVCSAPTFYPLRTYYFDDTPSPGFMEVADINGDGLPDILAGETVTGAVTKMTVMLGTGTFGGFRQEISVPVGGNPRSITTGDVNNDGFIDVINTQYSSIEIYLGNGTGNFGSPLYYNPAPADNPRFSKTIAKDLNADGKLDLVIVTSFSPQIYVRLGNGDGTFNQTQTIAASGGAFLNAEDINNDGNADLIVSNYTDYPAYVYLGRSDGTFGPRTVQPSIPNAAFQFVDVNGDGYKDIVSASTSVYVQINDQNGGFGPASSVPLDLPAGTMLSTAQLADFDGDGILDAAFMSSNYQLYLFKGHSLSSFELTQSSPTPQTPYDMHVQDLNRDGMPDISFISYNAKSAYTMINKCGDDRPTYSISGSFTNAEGYTINGARVDLESSEMGVLSSSGGTYQQYVFTDLPAGGSYKLTPVHSLFTFIPPSVQLNNLSANRTVDFAGGIRHFRIEGGVLDYSHYTVVAADVPMRLVGPFSDLTGLPVANSPQVDFLIRTDEAGKYVFKDVLPISAFEYYQIQFPADPIWYGVTPVKAVRGLTSDQYYGFYAGRNSYTLGVHLTMPNGLPRASMPFYEVEQNKYHGRYFITDANGRGSLNNMGAGLFHSLYNVIPSFRFSPDTPAAPYLSGNTEVETKVSLRNPTDFDNDGKTDLAVWRPESTSWYVQNSSDGTLSALGFGLSTDIPVPADYDGDQKTDIAVFRPADGNWYVYTTGTRTFSSFHFGMDGDIPIPADFDREGKADYTVFRPSTGVWYNYQSFWKTIVINQWGQAGDRPVVGDFDGDTYNDIAVYRPSTGVWYLLQSVFGFRAIQFGLPNDKVFTGDFDGDTISDLGVWRPETGTWYVLRSSDVGITTAKFGMSGDQPLSGDFDGDGKADFAVYRPSSQIWYGLKSSNSEFWGAKYGAAGDIPVPSMRVR